MSTVTECAVILLAIAIAGEEAPGFIRECRHTAAQSYRPIARKSSSVSSSRRSSTIDPSSSMSPGMM